MTKEGLRAFVQDFAIMIAEIQGEVNGEAVEKYIMDFKEVPK